MPIFEIIFYFLFINDFNQSSGSGQRQPVDDVSVYRYMDKQHIIEYLWINTSQSEKRSLHVCPRLASKQPPSCCNCNDI